jgi:hypothetical protein
MAVYVSHILIVFTKWSKVNSVHHLATLDAAILYAH